MLIVHAEVICSDLNSRDLITSDASIYLCTRATVPMFLICWHKQNIKLITNYAILGLYYLHEFYLLLFHDSLIFPLLYLLQTILLLTKPVEDVAVSLQHMFTLWFWPRAQISFLTLASVKISNGTAIFRDVYVCSKIQRASWATSFT